MAIPQFHNEGVDQNGTSTITVSFAGFTWSANDIIEIIIATDGYVPSFTTANGFVLAQDPVGNTASVTTNGGTAGTAECGIFVYWKRAAGSTTTTDPPPVFAAPNSGGTCWCLQPNSFSGARTSGTPYHAITTQIISSATTAVTSVAASSTLANCLFMPRVASSTDDQAFNNWTMTGSAGPSGTGAPNTGWHNGSGNQCAFTGDEGGFAAATSNVTATTTFANSTKQALVTLVLASLAEPFAADDDAVRGVAVAQAVARGALPVDDDLAVTTASAVDEDGPRIVGAQAAPSPARGATSDDDLPQAAVGAQVDEDGSGAPAAWAPVSVAIPVRSDDEQPTATASIIDDESRLTSWASAPPSPMRSAASDDEQPTVTVTQAIEDDAWRVTPALPAARPTVPPPVSDEIFALPSLALGVMAFREKANTTTPNTGTVTTLAVLPAWAPSTSYQIINDPRVTNSGNAYECATGGTSASSGGPTTTPAPVTNGAITDGSAKWNFLAAGTGACDTQSSGSLFLVSTGQGNDATSGTTPTDNKSNSYSIVGSKSFFAGFPQSSAATYVAALPSTGGTGHTVSGTYGLGLDGGGDERTLAFVEVIGGTTIQDHATGEITPVSNVCTSNPVTTTGPAVLVCFCWLNGTVQADGFLHTATPGSGFSTLWLASGLLEIANGAGQVQMTTIYKQVASAGTYTASITTVGGEGAVMHLIAVQGAGPSPMIDEDVGLVRPVVSAGPVLQGGISVDEIAVQLGDDAAVMPVELGWAGPVAVGRADADEVMSLSIDEDPTLAVSPVAPVSVTPARVDADEIAAVPAEDDAAVLGVPVGAAGTPGPRADADDLAPVAPVAVDDDVGVAQAVVQPSRMPGGRQDADDLATAAGASIPVDEDPAVSRTAGPVPPGPAASRSEDEVMTLAVFEDEAVAAGVPSVGRLLSTPPPADDDLAPVAIDEEQPIATPLRSVPPWFQLLFSDDDLGVSVWVDDETQNSPAWPSVPPAPASAGSDDEAPTPVVAPTMVEEDALWTAPAALPVVVVATRSEDQLPRIVVVRRAAASGTGLLDGGIAGFVFQGLSQAGMTKSGVLIKVTPGTRTVGRVTGGTNPTETAYKVSVIPGNLTQLKLAGTLIEGVDRVIKIFGASLKPGIVPVAGDKITMDGVTSVIVGDSGGNQAVVADPARAMWVCQCKN